MTTPVVDISIAVTDALNAATFSPPFMAERGYLPKAELPELANLHVTVVPKGEVIITADRTRAQHDVQVDVAVQKKVDPNDTAAIDTLMELMRAIADHLRTVRPAGAAWIKTEHKPTYSPDHLERFSVLTAVTTLTYRTRR
ncbi:MAG: hypothetical protein GC159_17390 [Phycisphaera sp.]|nr:hypothetical protein [Phycisphaera sp.]